MDLKMLIGIMVFAVIAISVVFTTVGDIANSAQTLTTVALENVTFTANNTNSTLAHTPVGTTTLYYFANTTFAIPTTKYFVNDNHIKVYANNTGFLAGTGAYPNVTNSTSGYYLSYEYAGSQYVGGTSGTLIGLLPLLLVVAFVLILLAALGLIF